ncbi:MULTISPECIES: phage tail protein [unclassified Geodermatophilus]|uniref:phage tail protein n=1 Tax=unclassified Geodermatophilus TaxID=2637632 RepID=UPI003EEEB565
MRIDRLRAVPHPLGHRIDVGWRVVDAAGATGVRVVRREGTHPVDPGDGEEVPGDLTSAHDEGLRAETTYYYSLFPFTGEPPQFADDPPYRISATATASYDFAGRMYDLLPAVYRRYDTVTQAGTAPVPGGRGQGVLRRFLELPGSQLDQLYSLARVALALHDVDRVDGRLLPLLARWIGWRTDHGLPVRAQRNEVRFAPHLYRLTGAVGPVTAAVRRVTGHSAQVKEYLHNVALTNQPERLNLWAAARDAREWTSGAVVSVDFAHDGRVAHVRDDDGADLFVFHTLRRRGWEIRAKRRVGEEWEPSTALVDRPEIDRDPAVARQGPRLWLFWNGVNARTGRWELLARTRERGTWSDPTVVGASDADRRTPVAVVDSTGGLWLFWREWAGSSWQVRYDRHDGNRWQLADPAVLRDGDGRAVVADDDLVAVAAAEGDAGPPLWLFWATRIPGPDGARRWAVRWRTKEGLDPATDDWSPVQTLPGDDAGAHDREPAPLLRTSGDLELFWATTRTGNWSIATAVLDAPGGTWGPVDRVGSGPFSNRAPLAVVLEGDRTLLLYRSNESLSHLEGRTVLDARYAGTTTVRSTDAGKIALRGGPEDFQTYTYDTRDPGPPGHGLVTRHTVGVFLGAATAPPARDRSTELAVARLERVLPEVLPVTVRAIVRPPPAEP